MNLYIIKRFPYHFVPDAFAWAIVAADSVTAARHTHPAQGVVWLKTCWRNKGKEYGFETWGRPQNVRARLIGLAVKGTKAGVISSTFL